MITQCIRQGAHLAALIFLGLIFGAEANAGVPVHVVKTDLKAGIRAGAQSPVQFAVLVPHAASTSKDGTWSATGNEVTWSYAVQVPTAVSLSFHATGVSLPESATLVVRGTTTTTSYRSGDVQRGELWSRIYPGDALQITLTVAALDREKVKLNVVSLQAGYRSLGGGVEDHPYYRQLKAQQAAAADNTSCITNYKCEVTAANTPPGSATVALLVENLYQCTGTLINDVPGDNTVYILTARHCESGALGMPGKPSAAEGTTVYWDAVSSCGSTLGSLYGSYSATSSGLHTVVEQQDMWLMRADSSPPVTDAQFAGFDVSGGAVQGGYAIHHAEGGTKQFTAWFGQAASVPYSGYANFLETVNQLGNIGPGASGSGLFDQNNHLVGSLTFGRSTADPSGYGSCPVSPLTAPNGSNGVADFTSLAALWSATGDPDSTTGSVTIKSVLDPANTGTLVVASAPAVSVVFGALPGLQVVGLTATLTWAAAGATQCTAGGGVAGDGWSGVLAASGSRSLTETNPTTATYTLICAYPSARTARSAVTIEWMNPAAQAQFHTPPTVWTTRPAVLSWSSNVVPCSISGGGLALSNLSASGSTTTTQSSPGDVSYRLACGPTSNSVVLGGLVQYVTPSLDFGVNGTDRLLGEAFFVQWLTFADSCTPSGGAPNDGWAGTDFNANGSLIQFAPHVTMAGTYTYTLTCSSGPISLQQSAVVTFENNPPFVTTAVNTASVTFSDSPADYATLTWNSNLSNCSFPNVPGLLVAGNGDAFVGLPLPQGNMTLAPYESGTYEMSIVCTGYSLSPTVTSTPITLTVLPPLAPTASISFNPSSGVVAGEIFKISWSSTNTQSCVQTDGIPGGGWGRPGNVPVAGSQGEIASAGQFTFGLTCKSIDPKGPSVSTQLPLTIVTLDETLAASATSVAVGDSFTVTWSSAAATSCAAMGGGANGVKWSGPLPTSGSVTQTATAAGMFPYEVDCSAGGVDVFKEVDITVTGQVTPPVPPSNGGSTGSGSGGGGAMGWVDLLLVAALPAVRRRPLVKAARRSGA